jgi:ribosome biogenesis GTPase A
MTKTRRMMEENIKLVDIVIELLDARVPLSSKNPEIDNLARNKFRIIVLNKSDLSNEIVNQKWKQYFEEKEFSVILTDSTKGKGIKDITEVSRKLMQEKIERQNKRGRIFVPIRAMIVGIPNVGKSTLINKYVGKAMTKTGDRPGVTRSKQWVSIKKDFELLDTPGILWPKFEDKNVALNLAFTGAIKDDILDIHTLSIHLLEKLLKIAPEALKERYKIEFDEDIKPHEVLHKVGLARGFKIKGNQIDVERAAIILVDEFRAAKLGKVSLERP